MRSRVMRRRLTRRSSALHLPFRGGDLYVPGMSLSQPRDGDETPATPSSESRQNERREQIVEAALAVFARDGFTAARTDAIAEQAGVAKGTLYLYFKSKEEMFEAAVRSRLLPVIEAVEHLQADPGLSAFDLLRQQLKYFYNEVAANDKRQIIRLILTEGSRFPRLAEFYFETIIKRGMTVMQRTFDRGVQTGEFVPIEGIYAQKVLMAPCIMAALWKLTFDDFAPLDLEQFTQTHFELLSRAIKAPG